ncbi:MAG: hypothetical protein LC737_11665, partial [Chloroflexi bacterium]|nr:hypothetical protein [Chloroflexota bacterium]
SQAVFEAQLGQYFNVDAGSRGKQALRLVQVNAGTAKVHAGPNRIVGATTGECFVLNFVGASDQPLPQDTYRFERSPLGKFDLFIVPGTADDDGQHYVAVVNHVRV